MHTLTRMGALTLSLLLIGSAVATAAPGKNKTKVKRQKTVYTSESTGLIRSGSTRYYDWELSLTGGRFPNAGVPGKPVAYATDFNLNARDNFVAVDSWGGAGGLNFLNSAVPVEVRWTGGEAWASANQRFTNLVLVAVESSTGATRPYLLQANGKMSIQPGTRALYAFFADIGPISDNRGEAQLALIDKSGRQFAMTVKAKQQAVSMEQTNAIAVDLVPGVSQSISLVRGNSRDGYLEAPMRLALLVADTAQGRHSLVVNGAVKTPLTFTPSTSRGYLAWVGFENVTEGTGSTTFQISGQRPGAIPKGLWEDDNDHRNEPGYVDWNGDDDDNWQNTSGRLSANSVTYELRLSQLAKGAQYTALLPIALEGVQPGDRVVITGQLPRDVRAGEVRLYTADGSDMPLVRASLATGGLAVSAEDDSAYSNRAWDSLVDDDPASDNLLAIGAANVRQTIPAGSTFRLTVDVAPMRDGRTGNPFTCYIGLAMTEGAPRAMAAALKTYAVADALTPIRLNPGRGLGNDDYSRDYNNDDDDDNDDDWYQD